MRHTTMIFFFFQAEDGIRDLTVTGVQTCALPILNPLTLIAVGMYGKTLPTPNGAPLRLVTPWKRSEERRVGKSVDLGGRRIIKKKKTYKLIGVLIVWITHGISGNDTSLAKRCYAV